MSLTQALKDHRGAVRLLLVAMVFFLMTALGVPSALATYDPFYYSLCSDAETQPEWDTETTSRRYRYTGNLDDCGSVYVGACNSVQQVGIIEVGDGMGSDTVGSRCGDVNQWDHGNVVARSRCRFKSTTGVPAQQFLSCHYRRHNHA